MIKVRFHEYKEEKKKKKGFTLIELLAVIVIIGVIALIATNRVMNTVKKARRNAFLLKATQVLIAAERDEVDNIDNLERSYIFPEDKTLSLKEYPKSGYVLRDATARYSLRIWSDKLSLCAVKDFDDKNVYLSSTIKKENECITLPGEEYFDESDLASNQYQIIYHSNYINGPASYRQIFKKDILTVLTDVQFTRDKYTFSKWNTMPDGSGTSYNNKAYKSNITKEKTGHLYAIWNPTKAVLLSGSDFNAKIKTIANESTMNAGTTDNLIKSISRSNVEPDISIQDSSHLVSTSSSVPAYAWFDQSSGSLNIWTSALLLDLPTNGYRTFTRLGALEKIDLSGFSSTSINSLREFFSWDANLKNIIGLDKLDTSKVKYMEGMFNGCSSIESLNLTTFKVELVTEMENAFSNMTNLKTINISGWDLQNASTFIAMFKNDTSLESIDLRSFKGPKISNISQMFSGCTNLKTIYLNNFKPVKATNFYAAFKNCPELTTIYVHPEWDSTLVNSHSDVFTGSTKLKGGSTTVYQGGSSSYATIDDPENSKPGYLTASNE